MVQILPPKTSLGNTLGQSLGQGIGSGIEQGSQIGFQRGLLQNSLKGLENQNPNQSPYQLASNLIKATAGIPGAERYVGQLFPLLLNQMRSEQAFGKNSNVQGSQQPWIGMQGEPTSPGLPGVGASAQAQKPSLEQGYTTGGILGGIIPQDEIDRQANQYAVATGTGLEGYQQMQANLIGKNEIAQDQRRSAENKAADIGVPREDIPLFLRLGQKHQYEKSLDEWVTKTQRDFREYQRLAKTLDSADFPGIARGLVLGEKGRSGRLKDFQNNVQRLVGMGLEQEVRQKLASNDLSPTEVEELIHPLSKQAQMDIDKIPKASGAQFRNPEKIKNDDAKVIDFLKKNVNDDTSLLVLRDKLFHKDYDWKRISSLMNQALQGRDLTQAQQDELNILEREAPRQSLNYIFQNWGNIIDAIRGQK